MFCPICRRTIEAPVFHVHVGENYLCREGKGSALGWLESLSEKERREALKELRFFRPREKNESYLSWMGRCSYYTNDLEYEASLQYLPHDTVGYRRWKRLQDRLRDLRDFDLGERFT